MHHGHKTELKQFMQKHFYEMFRLNIDIGFEYGNHDPHSANPVTSDLDELLSEMTGAERRLDAWRALPNLN